MKYEVAARVYLKLSAKSEADALAIGQDLLLSAPVGIGEPRCLEVSVDDFSVFPDDDDEVGEGSK